MNDYQKTLTFLQANEQYLRDSLFAWDVPTHNHQALMDYLLKGYEPGGFLVSVMANDLAMAVGRADHINSRFLRETTAWVINHVPSLLRGSYEAVSEWVAAAKRGVGQ